MGAPDRPLRPWSRNLPRHRWRLTGLPSWTRFTTATECPPHPLYTCAMEPSQPPLPRPPGDEENLRRLRKEAAERMAREVPMGPKPSPAYRPAPVYGGPPIITRRWTLRGVLMLMVSSLVALAAALWGYRKITTPVYGGPPAPSPSGPVPPSTVYGGPPPPQESQRPPAPVYGGPPPPQPSPPQPPAPPK
jgi:hypothetical protein